MMVKIGDASSISIANGPDPGTVEPRRKHGANTDQKAIDPGRVEEAHPQMTQISENENGYRWNPFDFYLH
jgi:hypothetical protein